MEFGWINIFGAAIVAVLLIPNIIWALKNRRDLRKCDNIFISIFDQAGLYGCILLMWLPLLVWKFGFPSAGEMVVYVFGNSTLLIVYIIFFIAYFRFRNRTLEIMLTVIPAIIFIGSGVLLRHWLLVCFGVIFATAHFCAILKRTKG